MDATSKLKATIVDMSPVGDRMRVSVRFNDGEKEWHRAFDIKYDRPISVEEFSVMLGTPEMRDKITPPVDQYRYLKEAKDEGIQFEIKLEREPENPQP